MTEKQQGLSAVDQAHALRLEGKREEALKLAVSTLNATPDDLGALWLVARLLLDAGRAPVAGPLAAYGVEASLRRGELPSGILCAQLALEAGGFADDGLRRLADAFGAGSPRLSDQAQQPPPLPVATGVAPLFANANGDALLAAVEKVATRITAQKHGQPEDAKVPRLPLFSALAPAQLLRLLNVIELRELKPSEHAVKQGEEGKEAFVLARGVLNVVRADSAGGAQLIAVLGPGALFGEMALVSDAPRAASVIAVEAAQLLVMPKAALEALAQQDPAIGRELGRFCHDRMLANLMRHGAVLSAVPAASRPELLARFGTQVFERGEPLIQVGEDKGVLFVIASGRVQVSSQDADGDKVRLAELGPGEVVGEISLVLRRPANADVIAANRTVCLTLTRESLNEAMRAHPAVLAQLYDIAVQRDDETRSVLAQGAAEILL